SYSTNNGDWSTSIPSLTGIVGQSSAIWARRYCASITGCTYSTPNLIASWSIVAEPTSPTTATKRPNQVEVCELVPLTITAAATGGSAGVGCQIEYRYSLNNGSTWTAWSTTIPVFNSTNTGDNIIQVRRNNCQTECDQPTTEVELARWQVTAGATSPFNVSKSP